MSILHRPRIEGFEVLDAFLQPVNPATFLVSAENRSLGLWQDVLRAIGVSGLVFDKRTTY
jgi:hypothetical protein